MDSLDSCAIALPGVEVRIVERCTSTNDVLLKQPGVEPVLLAAEEQTAGRGRRGRRWHSAPGAGLTFSLARQQREPGQLRGDWPRHQLPPHARPCGEAGARSRVRERLHRRFEK